MAYSEESVLVENGFPGYTPVGCFPCTSAGVSDIDRVFVGGVHCYSIDTGPDIAGSLYCPGGSNSLQATSWAGSGGGKPCFIHSGFIGTDSRFVVGILSDGIVFFKREQSGVPFFFLFGINHPDFLRGHTLCFSEHKEQESTCCYGEQDNISYRESLSGTAFKHGLCLLVMQGTKSHERKKPFSLISAATSGGTWLSQPCWPF